jgi:hypothetical protein
MSTMDLIKMPDINPDSREGEAVPVSFANLN